MFSSMCCNAYWPLFACVNENKHNYHATRIDFFKIVSLRVQLPHSFYQILLPVVYPSMKSNVPFTVHARNDFHAFLYLLFKLWALQEKWFRCLDSISIKMGECCQVVRKIDGLLNIYQIDWHTDYLYLVQIVHRQKRLGYINGLRISITCTMLVYITSAFLFTYMFLKHWRYS